MKKAFASIFQSRPIPHYSSATILVVLWLSSGLIWYCSCRGIKTPRIFGDELSYWDLARSFHQGAKLPYWSVSYDLPSQFFSLLISPVFAFHRPTDAYQIARLITAFLITTVVFPAYLLARELVGRRSAFAVALLSVATPCMTYSSTLMTENLFYPLFVAAFWSAYRALSSGRGRDCLAAAALFAASYYAKPHTFVLVVAYALCTVFWLLASLLGRPPLQEHGPWRGFAWRLVPIAGLTAALAPRIFAISTNDRSLTAILFGRVYQRILQAHSAAHFHDLFAAWSGLLLATLIATAFVPFAVFVVSGAQLKVMDARRRLFWLLTTLVWCAYTAMVARHTVLNDGSVRIHERYIFVVFPQFFVWYFLVRGQQSRRSIAVASLIAVAIAAAIMRWPAHVFLTPHVNTDSPSLTAFLWLALRNRLTFAKLALSVAILGTTAVLVALSRKAFLHVFAWTLLMAAVSAGWVRFEERWINPLHVRLQELAMAISSQVGPQATLGMAVYDNYWLPRFHCGFWLEQPTILYDIPPDAPSGGFFNWQSPNVRHLTHTADGNLDFGNPAPDYLLSSSEFSEPLRLVKRFPTPRNTTLYLYRIPSSGRK